MVVNHQGELITFKITRGNVRDINISESLLKTLQGVVFGNNGYIGKRIFNTLFNKGLNLIARIRRNMKKKPLAPIEKQLLNQRGIIETVINDFKHYFHIWHTRHRVLSH